MNKKRKAEQDITPIIVEDKNETKKDKIIEEIEDFLKEGEENIKDNQFVKQIEEKGEELKKKLLNLYIQNPEKTVIDIPQELYELIDKMDETTLSNCIQATLSMRNGKGKYDQAITKIILKIASLIPKVDVEGVKKDLEKDEQFLLEIQNIINNKIGNIPSPAIVLIETLLHIWNNFHTETISCPKIT